MHNIKNLAKEMDTLGRLVETLLPLKFETSYSMLRFGGLEMNTRRNLYFSKNIGDYGMVLGTL